MSRSDRTRRKAEVARILALPRPMRASALSYWRTQCALYVIGERDDYPKTIQEARTEMGSWLGSKSNS